MTVAGKREGSVLIIVFDCFIITSAHSVSVLFVSLTIFSVLENLFCSNFSAAAIYYVVQGLQARVVT
jgi:hypothetical protein